MGFFGRLFGGKAAGVRLLRRYSEDKLAPSGRVLTYRYEVYQAATAQEAREFLDGKSVTEKYTYIVVETPEGNWGKDIASMYKEE